MDKYEVYYEWKNAIGEDKSDFLNNGGKGFTFEEAKAVARNLQFGSAYEVTLTVVRRI